MSAADTLLETAVGVALATGVLSYADRKFGSGRRRVTTKKRVSLRTGTRHPKCVICRKGTIHRYNGVPVHKVGCQGKLKKRLSRR